MTTQNDSDSSSDFNNQSVDTSADGEVIDAETISDAPEQTESSTVETPGAKPTSLHDIIKNVVEGDSTAASPAKTNAEESETQKVTGTAKPDPSSSDDADDIGKDTPEDDEKLPFHKHPRWQAVIKERNEAVGQLAVYQDKAAQFDAISDFMADSRLSSEEVNRALVISAAVKNDPVKAYQMLTETINYLRGVTGEDLPEDVVKMVDDGDMSEAAAREVAKARAQVQFQEQRMREQTEQSQQTQAQVAFQQIQDAVVNWEQRISASDPDYQAKRTLVHEYIRLAHLEKPARNATEALAIAEAALTRANNTAKSFRPKQTEIKSPASAQSLPAARPQPKTLKDVIKGAVS